MKISNLSEAIAEEVLKRFYLCESEYGDNLYTLDEEDARHELKFIIDKEIKAFFNLEP